MSRSRMLVALAMLGAFGLLPTPSAHAGAIDLAGRDTTCSPCRDFFQYASGTWLDRTPIPSIHQGVGSFQALDDRNEENLWRLLENAARTADGKTGANSEKLGTFYGTCMDSVRAEAEGLAPLEPALRRLEAIHAPAELAAEIARLHTQGVFAGFRFSAAPDFKNSRMTIAVAGQGGLGLPDRDYYLKSDSASARIRSEYVAHIGRLMQLLGEPAPQARKDADRVMALETGLARVSMTNVERRDPNATYHKMPVAQLRANAPTFDWPRYLTGMGQPALDQINVQQPAFFAALDSMVRVVPLDDWKVYLRWQLAKAAAPLLSSAFVNEDFRLQQVLTGAKELPPRWKRCVQATDGAVGDALGEEYVKQYFPPQARTRALELVQNLEAALDQRLAGLEWMGDSTRAQARGKLQAFGEKIGYPDRWRDYSKLVVERGSFLANFTRATEFETRRTLGKIGQPVDRGEWRMTPPTVNAYYSGSNNDINFPAGILQAPFFDPEADDAVNYGAIGAVIGHEMTHGFDDRGRQFDADGNLRDWWTSEDARQYRERADRIVDQFNGYVVIDTLHVNGKLTLGENIADLGGLAVAYAALQKTFREGNRPIIDGYTPEQRFFLSWARVWRAKFRPEAARLRVATDSHSPPRWRVNGPLSNLPEFARAFGCRKEDPMVRSEGLQVRIW